MSGDRDPAGIPPASPPEHLVRRACRAPVEHPASGDGCEHGDSTAGAVPARPFGDSPRWLAEAAVREARDRLAADPALRPSLRDALA